MAVAAREEHCNRRGFVHGGLLCTLADIAMGYHAAARDGTLTPHVTASLDLAFVRPAQCGDWIEAHVEIIRSGHVVTFAAARVVVGAAVIATGSATFVATGEDARCDERPMTGGLDVPFVPERGLT